VLCQVISWLLRLLDWEEEGLDGLVKFVRGLWIYHLVVEGEFGVLKIFFDGHLGVQVDWSTSYHAWILIWVEILSWPLSKWIFVRFAVVILEIASSLAFLGAVGNAPLLVDDLIGICGGASNLFPIYGIL